MKQIALAFCVLLSLQVASAYSQNPEAMPLVRFTEDVEPIFVRSCTKCHGSLRQESNYRLDHRVLAIAGGASDAPSIVPFKSDDSPLIQYVSGQVDGMLMPPRGSRLTSAEINVLRLWIDQGAVGPDSSTFTANENQQWWSIRPLVRPPAPVVLDGENVIDAFIRDRLNAVGLSPSPPASREVLLRRVYFDLIGLPPNPDECESFMTDSGPLAYERLVDRLLASPRYGERWARYWMDAAHFAETHGHDQDRIRENAWPYRDYLIDAFNHDTPYGQFVCEQLAADAIPQGVTSKIAALGFLAAGPWDESTLRDIREDTLDRQIGRYIDRDDMLTNVMTNFTSLTVHCARCHDHKFDPISQSDYYSLQAVFAGVERANRSFDFDPSIEQRRQKLRNRIKQLDTLDSSFVEELLGPESQQALVDWELSNKAGRVDWLLFQPTTVTAINGSELTYQHDGSYLASGERPERDTYELSGVANLSAITGIRLELLTDKALPFQGPGRQDNGNLHLSEFEIDFGGDNHVQVSRALSDFDQDGWGVQRAVDGKTETAWGIYPQVGKSHEAIFEFANAIPIRSNTPISIRLKQLHGGGHLIGRFRVSVTSDQLPLSPSVLPTNIEAILATDIQSRSKEQRIELAVHFERERLSRELDALPKPSLVYAAAADFEPDGSLVPPTGPRPIHRLERGDIRSPKELAIPGALTCISALPARFQVDSMSPESARRAALAKWLVHKDNPLIWRSIVNRIWQHHFGRGIVDTANDFGKLGSQPTHPELLDWLATDFRDSGQSIKKLHRSILLSNTYRQSSRTTEVNLQGNAERRDDDSVRVDSDNRLLWRMNRTRLDAECIRDAMLSISGQLDSRMGGPSDRQFDLKPGRHVTPVVDYGLFDLDSSAARRRSVYRFLFRTLPDPFMEALDCPAGDQIVSVRANSVTVQQALALWNDSFVLRMSEIWADKLQLQKGDSSQHVTKAIVEAFCRNPQQPELDRFIRYAEKHGLANLCRLLLNTNEFIFVD